MTGKDWGKKLYKRLAAAVLIVLSAGSALLSSCGPQYAEPPFSVRSLQMESGSVPPSAEDFITDVRTQDGRHTVDFIEKYDFAAMAAAPASYELTLLFSDTRGYVVQAKTVLTVIAEDTKGPVITVVDTSPVTVGSSVAYRSRVTVEDDCFGAVTLTCDADAVNLKKPGTYPVCYTAVDAAGNRTELYTTLSVVPDASVTLDTLNASLDRVINQIITPDMDTAEKLTAVYHYVYDAIRYTASSDKTSWVDEAYHALFKTGQGDCFSYFAAAKAFCERLGIENMDVQRLPGFTEDTHYWSMVNIGGAGDAAVWYHFDCCHLAAEYNHSGCLLTDVQVDAYNTARPHFYEYDKKAYPPTAQKIITPTPALEPFYR